MGVRAHDVRACARLCAHLVQNEEDSQQLPRVQYLPAFQHHDILIVHLRQWALTWAQDRGGTRADRQTSGHSSNDVGNGMAENRLAALRAAGVGSIGASAPDL